MKSKRSFKPAIVPLEEAKKAAILAAVKRLKGNVVLAAERLEIGKTTLYRKLRQYGAIPTAGGGKRLPSKKSRSFRA